MKRILPLLILSVLIGCIGKQAPQDLKMADYGAVISTSVGDIDVHLYNATPLHRDNFVKLAGDGAYDGVLFHRVIEDFMIQAAMV